MLSPPQRQHLIEKFRALPAQVAQLTAGLTAEQFTTPYLDGEWTVAQNVHHLPDSHMNSYVRCKLIATEDNPPLKPYDQDLWAAFPDAQAADISGSLALLGNLHTRWEDRREDRRTKC
jgi:DinB superfamily